MTTSDSQQGEEPKPEKDWDLGPNACGIGNSMGVVTPPTPDSVVPGNFRDAAILARVMWLVHGLHHLDVVTSQDGNQVTLSPPS